MVIQFSVKCHDRPSLEKTRHFPFYSIDETNQVWEMNVRKIANLLKFKIFSFYVCVICGKVNRNLSVNAMDNNVHKYIFNDMNIDEEKEKEM